MTIDYIDMQDRTTGTWSWHFMSIDLGSSFVASNVKTSSTDLG
jgi:hypothetical protein